MRNKTWLALTEQLVMVLIFAIAGVICLKVFAASGQISGKSEALSEAVLLAQNTAEQIKGSGGKLEQIFLEESWCDEEGCWELEAHGYPGNKGETGDGKAAGTDMEPGESSIYHMKIREEATQNPYLGKAVILIWEADGEERDQAPLFELTVAWQKNPEDADALLSN